MTIEHWIVGATGLGYFIVGLMQWSKGETANGMIWSGYAFAQIGLSSAASDVYKRQVYG